MLTTTYAATVRNSNGYIITEMVTVANGDLWQVKQIIEGRYGVGSYLGASQVS
jgi:hypothetical protein